MDQGRNTYTDKWHKDLTRVFLFVVNHCLCNRYLGARTGSVQIALHSIRNFHNIRFALRLIERCGSLAVLMPTVDAEHGAVRRVEGTQIAGNGAGT